MEPPIRWHPGAIGALRGPQKRSERPVSCGPVLSGPFGVSGGEDLLVGDWRQHLAGAVPTPVVVGVDEGGDVPARLVLGGEVPSRQELPFEGRVEALRGGVVECGTDPAHGLDRAERTTGLGEHVTDVLAALVGMAYDAGDVAA